MPGSVCARFAGLGATVLAALAVLVAPTVADAQTTTSTPSTTSAATGRVTGRVWHDIDGDRVVDAGEAAVVGVEVLIIDGSGRLADRPITVSTDAAGRFDVVVTAGTYQACFGSGSGDLRLQAIANPGAPNAWTEAVNRNCSEAFPVGSGSVVQVDSAYSTDLPPNGAAGRPPSDPRGVLAETGIDASARMVLGSLLVLLGIAVWRVASRLTAQGAR